MANFRHELPPEGLSKVDVELRRGSITVRKACSGEVAALESSWELNVTTDGSTVRVRQPLDIKRPLDLADLIGEQQVRIEIEGVVLLDKQIRRGGGDVEIVLPTSVREVRLRTARGDVHLEGIEVVAEAYAGRGNLILSGGRGIAEVGTATGDVKVSSWVGPLRIRTGRGNLEAKNVQGHFEAKTGKGEIGIDGAREWVEAHTGHGNVVASRLSGEASLSTGHGDLVATDVDGAQLEGSTGHGGITVGGKLLGAKVKTGHGDVLCRFEAAEGDYELHTGQGNISLDMGEDVVARIDSSTRHGGIDSNLPLVKVGTSGPEGIFSQRLVGTAAGSGPTARINLTTNRGDIRIFRREGVAGRGRRVPDAASSYPGSAGAELPAQPEATTASTPEMTPASLPNGATSSVQSDRPGDLRLEVLTALSRGELSVDEALLLLERTG